MKLVACFAPGLLFAIAIPTVELEGYRALVWRRKRIAERRGKIKGFLLTSDIEEPQVIQKWSLAASKDLTALDVPARYHMALASTVREYLFLFSKDKLCRAEIRAATKQMLPNRASA